MVTAQNVATLSGFRKYDLSRELNPVEIQKNLIFQTLLIQIAIRSCSALKLTRSISTYICATGLGLHYIDVFRIAKYTVAYISVNRDEK